MSDATGSGLEPGTLCWVEGDIHRITRLQPVRKSDPVEIVRDDGAAFGGEPTPLHGNLADRDTEVSGVDHVDPVGPSVTAGIQADKSDLQANGVTPDHPPSVEDAQCCAGNRNSEGDPAHPLHAAEDTATAASANVAVALPIVRSLLIDAQETWHHEHEEDVEALGIRARNAIDNLEQLVELSRRALEAFRAIDRARGHADIEAAKVRFYAALHDQSLALARVRGQQ